MRFRNDGEELEEEEDEEEEEEEEDDEDDDEDDEDDDEDELEETEELLCFVEMLCLILANSFPGTFKLEGLGDRSQIFILIGKAIRFFALSSMSCRPLFIKLVSNLN